MKDHVLVVGASGNIGSEVARLLDQDGKRLKTASRHPQGLSHLENARPDIF